MPETRGKLRPCPPDFCLLHSMWHSECCEVRSERSFCGYTAHIEGLLSAARQHCIVIQDVHISAELLY